MYRIDLHTHSVLSHDGGISESDYKKILDSDSGKLDFVAVTDHNEIDFALKLRKKLGNRVIVGEEIMTRDGEVLGLYLTKRIPPKLDLLDATRRIIDQGGVVYTPHPFHPFRSSLSIESVEKILEITDQLIIEVHNARTSYFTRSLVAHAFSEKHNLAKGASSDSHCKWGIGTYTDISDKPNPENLVSLIKSGQIHSHRAPSYSLFCPKINVFRKMLFH